MFLLDYTPVFSSTSLSSSSWGQEELVPMEHSPCKQRRTLGGEGGEGKAHSSSARVKPLLTSLPSCVRSQHIHANSLINLYFAQLSNFFRPIAYGCLTLEKRDNGVCQSHVSFAASNGMGDGGGGRPRGHRRRSVEFRQQQPVLPGTGGYAVGPEPWEAGWAGGCAVAGGEPVCSWA